MIDGAAHAVPTSSPRSDACGGRQPARAAAQRSRYIENRVQENLTTIREQAKQEARFKAQGCRKRTAIMAMQKQIEDLKRRSDQGSQQLQGEAQIERVMQSTVGMYGDLQGIAGRTLQEIEGLEMKTLGHSTTS